MDVTGTYPSEGFDDGWDMSARLVDGRWVERTPRRPEVVPQALREAGLLPWLAPLLPLPVPVPALVSTEPVVLRHVLVPGEPCPGSSPGQGRALGAFLAALHAVDVTEATAHGARDAAATYAERSAQRERLRTDVLPLVDRGLRDAATALLERAGEPPPDTCLTHGDLGPNHVLVSGDEVRGVIDWGDSGVGDPAIDLAWCVHGTSPRFAEAVLAAYRPSESLLSRAHDLHLLGPWHEVLFGIDTGRPAYVASGLAGARDRLRRARPGSGG